MGTEKINKMENSDKNRVLKQILESLYKKYNHKKFIPPDPLQFVYHYKNRTDMEIAGFLSAMFAYGAVEQIEKFLTSLFAKMGHSPGQFVKNFTAKDKKLFADLKYRFNTSRDIIVLLQNLKKVLNSHGSLENLFLAHFNKNDANVIPAASKFINALNCKQTSSGLKFLLADPANGGTCKRLFLFLRWMVRNDAVDTGLWKKVDKSKLIVPVDVHMGRLSKIMGLHNRKTLNLAAAIEITDCLSRLSPSDPVKYDFALCRIGIIENCSGKPNKYCPECKLAQFCAEKLLKK